MDEYPHDQEYGHYSEEQQQSFAESSYLKGEEKVYQKEKSSVISVLLEFITENFKSLRGSFYIFLGILGILGGWYSLLLLPSIFVPLGILVGFGIGGFFFIAGIYTIDKLPSRKFFILAIASCVNGGLVLWYWHTILVGQIVGYGLLGIAALFLIMAFICLVEMDSF